MVRTEISLVHRVVTVEGGFCGSFFQREGVLLIFLFGLESSTHLVRSAIARLQRNRRLARCHRSVAWACHSERVTTWGTVFVACLRIDFLRGVLLDVARVRNYLHLNQIASLI